ncbi:VCBS repeat domain-containing M23 family metallopeptidase [Patescibacteria group bacterium]|nr:VCBS repeat domain-containing M23 family metallopeptidase [Patescibacteria group bacterium]MBU1673426.1 VCBS repeat domain-containing M23 family metallopeptidase [Patescibacteria group bacterium]MBU1963373.1 VCBS repeat domain-containing M23 family metallopeptidase [Patescibacteria group bacterium]
MKKALIFSLISSLCTVFCANRADAQSVGYPLDIYTVTSASCDFLGECAMTGLHLGEDASASADTPVYAPADGWIRDATEHTYYGMVILLDANIDGEEVVILMAHMSFSDRQVSVGDYVDKGELLGYIGNSSENGGWSPHLHYGIHKGSFGSTPTYSCDGNWSYAGYSSQACVWDDWYDPTDFIESHQSNCYNETVQTYDNDPVYGFLVVTDPDGDNFDFHEYYEDNGSLELLNRGDMGSGFANPVINDEGSVENKEKWLVGDVDANGYDDIVLITHPTSNTFKAHVWLSNGDGTFQPRDRWIESTGQADLYFLGDKNGDGDWDLIIATQVDATTVRWDKCPSNGSEFEACHTWVDDFGSDVENDIFLVDDFSGNGKADLLRGYEHSSNDSCYTGGKKLRWRMYTSGETVEWLDNWGCKDSDYLSGNFNDDWWDRSDLLQVRFDDSDTGHVYVAKSDGVHFYSTDEWKADFGSPDHRYFVWDINQDGADDLIDYKDDGNHKITVVYSNGNDGGFGYNNDLISGVDKETGGAFRFGYFSDIHLAIGEEAITVCD